MAIPRWEEMEDAKMMMMMVLVVGVLRTSEEGVAVVVVDKTNLALSPL